MGKTYLLTHVAWLLSERNAPDQNYLIGFAQAIIPGTDLILRSVEDLYTHWLQKASLSEQGKHLWLRHADKLTVGVGRVVGTIVESLSEAVGIGSVGKLVHKAFDALATGIEDQRSGGLSLPKLDYFKARELVQFCAEVSGKPILLFIDKWERSSLETDAAFLGAFLGDLENWPCCHIFLGTRPNELTLAYLNSLQRESPAATTYPLGLMQVADGKQRVIDGHQTSYEWPPSPSSCYRDYKRTRRPRGQERIVAREAVIDLGDRDLAHFHPHGLRIFSFSLEKASNRPR